MNLTYVPVSNGTRYMWGTVVPHHTYNYGGVRNVANEVGLVQLHNGNGSPTRYHTDPLLLAEVPIHSLVKDVLELANMWSTQRGLVQCGETTWGASNLTAGGWVQVDTTIEWYAWLLEIHIREYDVREER